MKHWLSDRWGIEFVSGKRRFYITNDDLCRHTIQQWLKVFANMKLSKEQTEEFKELYNDRAFEGAS